MELDEERDEDREAEEDEIVVGGRETGRISIVRGERAYENENDETVRGSESKSLGT